MKSVSEAFKNAVKSDIRDWFFEFEIYDESDKDNANRLFKGSGNDITNLTYRAEVERHIGGIEYKTATFEFRRDDPFFETLADLKFKILFRFGLVVASVIEWCEMGEMYASVVKENVKKKKITAQFVGYTNKAIETPLREIDVVPNTTLTDYAKVTFPNAEYNANNAFLFYAFYTTQKKQTEFDLMAKAMGAVMRSNHNAHIEFELIAPASLPLDAVPQSCVFELDGGRNGMRSYDAVSIVVSKPYRSEVKSLASARFEVGAFGFDKIGDIVLRNPTQTTKIYVESTERILVNGYTAGQHRVNMQVQDLLGESQTGNVRFEGFEYAFTDIDRQDVDDTQKKLVYTNPYIQDAALSTLYTGLLTNGQFDARFVGIPYYEPGDTIEVFGAGWVTVTSLNLVFNGAMSGNISGVVIVF